MVYLGLITWELFCVFLCLANQGRIYWNTHKRLFLILFFGATACVMGLRSTFVGVDTKNYLEIYDTVSKVQWKDFFSLYQNEVLYYLLMKICYSIYPQFYLFNFLISAIINVLMALFIKNNINNYFFASSLYLFGGMFLYSMCIQRQMLAVMITANLWTLLKKKKRIASVILFCVAFLIHESVIVFLVAFIIYYFRKNIYILKLVPFIILIIALKFRKILEIISLFYRRFKNYYGNMQVVLQIGNVRYLWILIGLISLYMIYAGKKVRRKLKTNTAQVINGINSLESNPEIYGIFSIIYIVCNVMGIFISYFERVGLYFMPFTLVLYEYFGNSIRKKNLRYMYFILLWVIYLFFFLLSIRSNQYQYSFFWN